MDYVTDHLEKRFYRMWKPTMYRGMDLETHSMGPVIHLKFQLGQAVTLG
uniref:Uncharacterized protein n=1 Tax=Arundo donax TaxID=35708 RepID=A0A0A9GN82_ARUDO